MTLVDPPPELKGRLLAKIDAYEAERGKAGERSPVGPRSRLPLLRSTLAFSVFSFSRRELMWVPLGAVMLLLVSWSIVQTLRVNDLSDDNGRLAGQVEDQQEALTFVASPSVQSAELQGSDPEARGTLFMDPTDNEFLMLVTGLVPLEEGRVYQLWAKRPDGSYASLGTFRTYPNGSVLWPFRSVAALGCLSHAERLARARRWERMAYVAHGPRRQHAWPGAGVRQVGRVPAFPEQIAGMSSARHAVVPRRTSGLLYSPRFLAGGTQSQCRLLSS